MQIELIYVIPISILLACAIAMFMRALSPMIALFSVLAGVGIGWAISPYTMLVMTPLANAIWYGHTWGMLEVLALLHIVVIFALSGVAIFNLWKTRGSATWK